MEADLGLANHVLHLLTAVEPLLLCHISGIGPFYTDGEARFLSELYGTFEPGAPVTDPHYREALLWSGMVPRDDTARRTRVRLFRALTSVLRHTFLLDQDEAVVDALAASMGWPDLQARYGTLPLLGPRRVVAPPPALCPLPPKPKPAAPVAAQRRKRKKATARPASPDGASSSPSPPRAPRPRPQAPAADAPAAPSPWEGSTRVPTRLAARPGPRTTGGRLGPVPPPRGDPLAAGLANVQRHLDYLQPLLTMDTAGRGVGPVAAAVLDRLRTTSTDVWQSGFLKALLVWKGRWVSVSPTGDTPGPHPFQWRGVATSEGFEAHVAALMRPGLLHNERMPIFLTPCHTVAARLFDHQRADLVLRVHLAPDTAHWIVDGKQLPERVWELVEAVGTLLLGQPTPGEERWGAFVAHHRQNGVMCEPDDALAACFALLGKLQALYNLVAVGRTPWLVALPRSLYILKGLGPDASMLPGRERTAAYRYEHSVGLDDAACSASSSSFVVVLDPALLVLVARGTECAWRELRHRPLPPYGGPVFDVVLWRTEPGTALEAPLRALLEGPAAPAVLLWQQRGGAWPAAALPYEGWCGSVGADWVLGIFWDPKRCEGNVGARRSRAHDPPMLAVALRPGGLPEGGVCVVNLVADRIAPERGGSRALVDGLASVSGVDRQTVVLGGGSLSRTSLLLVGPGPLPPGGQCVQRAASGADWFQYVTDGLVAERDAGFRTHLLPGGSSVRLFVGPPAARSQGPPGPG